VLRATIGKVFQDKMSAKTSAASNKMIAKQTGSSTKSLSLAAQQMGVKALPIARADEDDDDDDDNEMTMNDDASSPTPAAETITAPGMNALPRRQAQHGTRQVKTFGVASECKLNHFFCLISAHRFVCVTGEEIQN
jgi:hypothetical protein